LALPQLARAPHYRLIDPMRYCTIQEPDMYCKEIIYDRETRDYAMYLDGELVGFARTYHEAEVALDQLVFEYISHQAPNSTSTATSSSTKAAS
jgi:hypothetical protein